MAEINGLYGIRKRCSDVVEGDSGLVSEMLHGGRWSLGWGGEVMGNVSEVLFNGHGSEVKSV
jgi:hypothetical protein